jgi:predicted DCC family thiol-disulfide oxidoreductase YuxK
MLGAMDDLPRVVVFFDAECMLCNRSVQWLMGQDKKGRLSFAPLGGETATALREAGVLTEEHMGGQSMVLAERGEDDCWGVQMRSDAVIRALQCAEGAPVRLAMLRMMPRFLREGGYRVVAKSRYVVFGRTEQCEIPAEGATKRVLR